MSKHISNGDIHLEEFGFTDVQRNFVPVPGTGYHQVESYDAVFNGVQYRGLRLSAVLPETIFDYKGDLDIKFSFRYKRATKIDPGITC